MRTLSIISGARAGLGKAMLNALQERAHTCIAITRSPINRGAVAQINADLAQDHDWPAIVGPMLSDLGFSHIAFFDIAAILPLGAALDEGFEFKIDEAMQVNVKTPLAIGRALARIANGRNVPLDVIHISSGAAFRPIVQWGAYCASKAAAAMAWRVFEAENDLVTTHIVDPGVIATDMQAKLRAHRDPNAAPQAALRTPDEAAREVLRQCGMAS